MSDLEILIGPLIAVGNCFLILLLIPIAEAIDDWRREREDRDKKDIEPKPEPKINISIFKDKP